MYSWWYIIYKVITLKIMTTYPASVAVILIYENKQVKYISLVIVYKLITIHCRMLNILIVGTQRLQEITSLSEHYIYILHDCCSVTVCISVKYITCFR